MNPRLRTYAAYSVACAFVWAVILLAVAFEASKQKMGVFLLVSLGWLIGWASATIARAVYPPPKLHRRAMGTIHRADASRPGVAAEREVV